MLRTMVLVVACLALLLGACAKKKGTAVSIDEVFVKYDLDKNGVITKDEFVSQWHDRQKAETAWKKIDAQNKGAVDRTAARDLPLDVWDNVESQDMP